MPKREPEPPRVSVKSRTEVTLSAAEVEHALRCWIDHGGAAGRVPKPMNFSNIQVYMEMNGYGSDLDTPVFGGATLIYEPLSAVEPTVEPKPEPENRLEPL